MNIVFICKIIAGKMFVLTPTATTGSEIEMRFALKENGLLRQTLLIFLEIMIIVIVYLMGERKKE